VRRNSQVDSSSGTNGKIEANATVFRCDWPGALGNPEEEEKEYGKSEGRGGGGVGRTFRGGGS